MIIASMNTTFKNSVENIKKKTNKKKQKQKQKQNKQTRKTSWPGRDRSSKFLHYRCSALPTKLSSQLCVALCIALWLDGENVSGHKKRIIHLNRAGY